MIKFNRHDAYTAAIIFLSTFLGQLSYSQAVTKAVLWSAALTAAGAVVHKLLIPSVERTAPNTPKETP